MLARGCRRPDRGVVLLEATIVLPVLFTMLFGLIVFGLGTFCYQQVAALAREGARYASVRGAYYKRDTGQAMATPSTVYTQAILPKAKGLDASLITYAVAWDDASKSPIYQVTANGAYRINHVDVTVSYAWTTLAFPGFANRTLTLSSKSRMPMTN